MTDFLQNDIIYYIICGILAVLILVGISLMSKVKTSVLGNRLSALATALAIIITLIKFDIISTSTILIICLVMLLIGALIGTYLAKKVKMIQMPEMVALLNGFGGAASAIVGACTMFVPDITTFEFITSMLAVIIGSLTFTGSVIAAGKLAKYIDGRPIKWKNHQFINILTLILILVVSILGIVLELEFTPKLIIMLALLLLSGFFGVAFAIRVGGADMPITISLLNSFSGVAGSIAGMAVNDILLVSAGGIVGASGLLLTQIMCKAMNRSLIDILLGNTSVASSSKVETTNKQIEQKIEKQEASLNEVLNNAKSVIIVPGYGMALSQAQHLVKQLADKLRENGANVRFAIHPVAGRMPGHMNVLLAEANVEYDELFELEAINDDFKDTDLCIVIGANDVINPAAREAEGTPIYGMPILNVDQAKHVIICNYDLKPGYAGVNNPLYEKSKGVTLLLGDAKDSISKLLSEIGKKEEVVESDKEDSIGSIIKNSKNVIIVPGYGMALSQAQFLVKQLADKLRDNGALVRFAIHPVAGRMPGHMNVLLAEANVEYDELFELEAINDDFKDVDLCIVIGANDVVNPAAREAEGTPIYGMPILNVDQAKHVIICNYDLKPGYSGVHNPLYDKQEAVTLLLGDAKDTLQKLITELSEVNQDTEEVKAVSPAQILKESQRVIIVPGYGMALAQAQHLVKQLADILKKNGTEVKYAIHPVAGRMPGHMNVLLAEANVDYDELYELEIINDEFKDTDCCVVVGANDVINPAAREQEGTPIYGMPILNVDQAKHVIICNYDLKPGYSGVHNPLYDRQEGVTLLLGDASDTLQKLINELNSL